MNAINVGYESAGNNTATKTLLHFAGLNSSGFANIDGGVIGENKDIIYISAGGNNSGANLTDINQKLNVDNTGRTNIFVGHSFGGYEALCAGAQYIDENPTAGPQIIGLLEPLRSKDNADYIASGKLFQHEIQSLKSNNALVIGTTSKNNEYFKGNFNIYNALAKNGVNVLVAYPDSNCSHGAQANFFYKDILSYVTGTSEAPSNLTYYVTGVDSDGNYGLVNIDVNSIKNASLLNAYFGNEQIKPVESTTLPATLLGIDQSKFNYLANLSDITVTSDKADLGMYLNTIRRSVKNTSFLSKEIPEAGFSSTTKVPSKIPSVVASYIAATTDMLECLANETEQMALIGDSIEKMDNDFSQQTQTLNQEVLAGSIAQATIPAVKNLADQAQTNNANNNSSNNSNGVDNNKNNGTNNTNKTTSVTNTGSVGNTNTTPSTNNTNHTNSNNTGGNTGSSSNNQANSNTNSATQGTTSRQEDMFYDYNTLTSNDNMLVYEYNNDCKIVIHRDNNRITGIEYYYKYADEGSALAKVNSLLTQYEDSKYIDRIFRQGSIIKIKYNKLFFSDLTPQVFIEKFVGKPEIRQV